MDSAECSLANGLIDRDNSHLPVNFSASAGALEFATNIFSCLRGKYSTRPLYDRKVFRKTVVSRDERMMTNWCRGTRPRTGWRDGKPVERNGAVWHGSVTGRGVSTRSLLSRTVLVISPSTPPPLLHQGDVLVTCFDTRSETSQALAPEMCRRLLITNSGVLCKF